MNKRLPSILLLPLSFALLASCSGSKKLAAHPKEGARPSVEHEFLVESSLEKAREDTPAGDVNMLQTYVEEWLGTPHQMGGTSKTGVDCSGFVLCAYRDVYGKSFRYRRSRDLLQETRKITQQDLVEGDLVFFKIASREINHVGIYLGDGYFAHASLQSGLTINNLSEKYYATYFYCGGRKL